MNLDTQLTQLESAQLVRRADDEELAYLFKHALTQEAAYESLLLKKRRELHQRIAETYERLYPEQLDQVAALLVRHYVQAGNPAKTVEYAPRAGARALRVYALREALDHYEAALSALKRMPSPSPLQEYDALMGWAEAALKFRPYPEQLDHLKRAEQIARDLLDKPRLARALYWTGRVHIAQGHAVRSIPSLVECFSLAHELGDERLIVVPTFSMGLAMLDTNLHEALALFERAIELARRFEDRDIEAGAWSAKGMAHARLGEFALGRAALEQAQSLIAQVQSPMAASDVDLFSGWAYLDMGDTEKGLKFGQLSVDKALASDNMDCVCGAFDCVGFSQLAAQRVAQAGAAFQEAIRRSQFSGADQFENWGRGGLAIAEFYGGRREALADLEKALARAQEINDGTGASLMAHALGRIYAAQGDTAKAESYVDQALAYYRRTQMMPYLARTLDTLAQVYERQGRTVEAARARVEEQALMQELAGANTGQPVPDDVRSAT